MYIVSELTSTFWFECREIMMLSLYLECREIKMLSLYLVLTRFDTKTACPRVIHQAIIRTHLCCKMAEHVVI